MTAFANITTLLMEILQYPTPVAQYIWRGQGKPVPSDVLSAVVVKPIESQLDRNAIRGAPIDLDSIYVVECYARTTEKDADAAVDDLLGEVYRRIAMSPTLGGAVMDCIVQNIRFDLGLEIDRVGAAVLTLMVRHRADGYRLE